MGALGLSAGGGGGAGALACSWGWLGQFAVEEGTFGSTVTVGRRARSRGWALVGGVWWERERCMCHGVIKMGMFGYCIKVTGERVGLWYVWWGG